MILNNVIEVKEFEKAINQARGSVWVDIKEINKNSISLIPVLSVDMKSSLSRYVALGRIIEESKKDSSEYCIELLCQYPEDEHLFFDFFQKYPDTLK